MTLPPEKIGDKGQRFQIKYSAEVDAMDDERCLGYAGTKEGAEQMADAWRKHPQGYYVWIVDRQASVTNEATPITEAMMSIPRRDPDFTAEALQRAADKFMDAGYEYWEACHKSGLVGGAVIWCADGSGRMALFTRGEYRQTILQNIDRIGNAHEFGAVNPAGE